jgi:hypothetical protein
MLELVILGSGKSKLSIAVRAVFIGCGGLIVGALISFEPQLNGAQDGQVVVERYDTREYDCE